ncbi:hypothetical protein JX266_002944 [Neoarthrinium moseri]|nr:hypothetical protein JX266_002944 [Neoarthrinium moseri]
MDECLFSQQLNYLRYIPEATSYLEILNYSDVAQNTYKAPDASNDFDQYLDRRGVFRPPELPEGVLLTSGLRLVLHKLATDSNTLAPNAISLSREDFEKMVRKLRLPLRYIETSTVVGPFFWWTYDDDDVDDTVLQIVFRKSDVSQNGNTRGWEMVLSYSFRSKITSGYVKGAENAEIEDIINQVWASRAQISHPLLLPLMFISRELASKNDMTQRTAREQLRRLENVLVGRYKMNPAQGHEIPDYLTMAHIKKTLFKCLGEVLWKRPQAWQNVVQRMRKASECFWDNLPDAAEPAEMKKLQRMVRSRFDFLEAKLEGLEHYAHVSWARLEIQRGEMHNIIAQVESRINADIARQSHLLANASKRESTSMKTLAILGSVFLPPTFLSSMFSMPFFKFDDDMNGSVSRSLWIYFVVAVPLTVIIVGLWWIKDRRTQPEIKEDRDAEEQRLDDIEARVIDRLRRTTNTRVGTGLTGHRAT